MDQEFGINFGVLSFQKSFKQKHFFPTEELLHLFALLFLFSIVNFFGQRQFFAVYLTSRLSGEIQCQCFTCSQASAAKSNKLRNFPNTHKGSSQLAMADNFPFLFLLFSVIHYLQPFFSIVNFVPGYMSLFLWVTLVSQISL